MSLITWSLSERLGLSDHFLQRVNLMASRPFPHLHSSHEARKKISHVTKENTYNRRHYRLGLCFLLFPLYSKCVFFPRHSQKANALLWKTPWGLLLLLIYEYQGKERYLQVSLSPINNAATLSVSTQKMHNTSASPLFMSVSTCSTSAVLYASHRKACRSSVETTRCSICSGTT